jgi:peptidoglycan/LPS O-acetylase OafA/YrhL
MPIIFWYYNHALNPHEHLWAIFGLVLLAALVSFYLVEVPLQRILSGAGKSSNK